MVDDFTDMLFVLSRDCKDFYIESRSGDDETNKASTDDESRDDPYPTASSSPINLIIRTENCKMFSFYGCSKKRCCRVDDKMNHI